MLNRGDYQPLEKERPRIPKAQAQTIEIRSPESTGIQSDG